jgi:DNA (cytosine-5)-methyltransferase 1
MRHGSLFSGIGGFDLASEWMGWENVFHCEIAEFPRKVLHYYWPNSISYENIKETDFTIHKGGIDILTGGFPCQPFSMAGKRKGTEDERHLWPEMLRAIREIQPRWIVGENVFGLVNWDAGLVFEQVQSDLEAEGYEVQAFILPAAAVNAPHRRDRVWFVAYSTMYGFNDKSTTRNNGIGQDNQQSRTKRERTFEGFGDEWDAADTESQRSWQQQSANSGWKDRRLDNNGKDGDAADTYNQRLQGREIKTSTQSKERKGKQCRNITRQIPIRWQNFPTQPPICGRNDGISTELDGITFSKLRNESIKGYGNAIVPQVVLQIFKAIEEYESRR